MPEDVFEGGQPAEESGVNWTEAVPQFPEDGVDSFTPGELVTGDFSPAPELVTVTRQTSIEFFVIEIPSLGVEFPIDLETAAALFDSLGGVLNGL